MTLRYREQGLACGIEIVIYLKSRLSGREKAARLAAPP
jgi:hypothetical protein